MKLEKNLKELLLTLGEVNSSIEDYENKHFKIIYENKMNKLLFEIDPELKSFITDRRNVTFSGLKANIINSESFLMDMDDYEYAECRFKMNDYESENNEVYRDFDVINYLSYAFLCAKNYIDKETLETKKPMNTILYINRVNTILLEREKDVNVYITSDKKNIIGGILKELKCNIDHSGIAIYAKLQVLSSCYKESKLGAKYGYVNILCEPKESVSSLNDLKVFFLDENTKEYLTKRAEKTSQYITKPTHCKYDGKAKIAGLFGKRAITIKEDVMIDVQAMAIIEGDQESFYFVNPHNNNEMIDLNKENMWTLSPYIYGMSLKSKMWVEMNIENISPITYSDTPFNELEIPDNYRKIIMSYLNNDIPSFDPIEGKGDGKIFFLYGLPGCGKTMTAEAIAEHLKAPLYNVTVGELGIQTKDVERALEDINQIASRWNAIVLLDEIDVFANARNNSDIEKNALTAVFLRFLEKFNGIIFMTTNLIDNIDKAFVSRAIKLKYEPLDEKSFVKIWKNIIIKMEKQNIKVDSKIYDIIEAQSRVLIDKMNGRDLKNFNRICFGLARENNNILDESIIDLALKIYY